MKAKDIIDRARVVLNDGDAVRWLDAELVNWINDGCRYIALVRPDACVANQDLTLIAGTKQSIAAQNPPGLRLLDVVRNAPNGRVIRLVDREVLDTQNPNWHSAQAGVTTNYVFDNRDPKTFYVYPPAVAGAKIEVIYSRVPADVTVATITTADLSVDDIYLDPLLNYVLFRSYTKDAEFAQNAQLAASYRNLCDGQLGVKTGIDAKFSPDLNSPGGRPSAATASGGV